MKKPLLILLSMVVILTAAIMGTQTASAATETDLVYKVTDGEAMITDCDESASGELVIPNTLDGYPVTSIVYAAFDGCSSLTSVEIPESVKSIGESAFNGCSGLTGVYISDMAAWCGIEFDDTDASNPLYYANNLYLNDELVTELAIPDGVTSIGTRAFSYCTPLKSVDIPDSVTSIGNYAFVSCNNLKSVDIPDSVTSMGNYAFYGCRGMENVKISNSLTSIGDYTFYYCNSLKNVVIPDSVKSIGWDAFYGCEELKNVELGKGVTSIGDYAFFSCSSLKNVYYTGSSSDWNNIYIASFNAPLTLAKRTYSYLGNDGVLAYAKNENAVEVAGFYDEEKAQITIPAEFGGYKVTGISTAAFRDCSTITSVEISEGVTVIGINAFKNCSNLKLVEIPKSVTTISTGAFCNLEKAFYNGSTSDWDKIALASDNSILKVIYNYLGNDGILAYTKNETGAEVAGFFGDETASVIIPAEFGGYKVTGIVYYAFQKCSSLTSVEIPDSITSIGEGVFCDCSSLTNVKIGNGLTIIRSKTFFNCSGLTSVEIPDSVTYIGMSAFYNCSSLASIVIPNSVTNIIEWAFYNCSNLSDVYYGGNEEAWKQIEIGSSNEPLGSATIHYALPNTLPGDLDGVEGITSDDAIYLLYSILFGEEDYPVTQDADFDGSGAVDSDDAIYLLYNILFGEEDYPLK